jgi:hypothetical protein
MGQRTLLAGTGAHESGVIEAAAFTALDTSRMKWLRSVRNMQTRVRGT